MLNINEKVLSLCSSHGLEFLGVVDPKMPEEEVRALGEWIDRKWHAGMEFMERHQNARSKPEAILHNVKSVISIGWKYVDWEEEDCGLCLPIAKYATYQDYHKQMKKKLLTIVDELKEEFSQLANANFRVTVDSAPILERALAKKTGEGFIGKNTCYIRPNQGSFLLLGEIHTDAEFKVAQVHHVDPSTRGEEGGCGSCRRCQVHCPTGALDDAYRLNAQLCLAYWTIEHRGTIPEKFWPWIPKSIFGCDICQDVCPYNRHTNPSKDLSLKQKRRHVHLSLFEMATMNQEIYEKVFGGTPMTRAKREGLRRNALIAMVMKADPLLKEALEMMENDQSVVLQETVQQIKTWLANP